MSTKKEWKDYFKLINGREPSLDEYTQALKNGEIDEEATSEAVQPSSEEMSAENAAQEENSAQSSETANEAVSGITEAAPAPVEANTPNNNPKPITFGWGVLGFFVPIVGLILFLVWHKSQDKPHDRAKGRAAGIGALIGVIIDVILGIIFGVIIMVAFNNYNNINKAAASYSYSYSDSSSDDSDDNSDASTPSSSSSSANVASTNEAVNELVGNNENVYLLIADNPLTSQLSQADLTGSSLILASEDTDNAPAFFEAEYTFNDLEDFANAFPSGEHYYPAGSYANLTVPSNNDIKTEYDMDQGNQILLGDTYTVSRTSDGVIELQSTTDDSIYYLYTYTQYRALPAASN